MKNQLQIFENKEFGQIRVIEKDGQPWFVGKDVAVVLGYNQPHKAIKTHVDEDDGMKHTLIDSMGRTQQATFINESGLYSLILSSKLPKAKAFKRWITSEVIPSIRRHGAYMTDETLKAMIADDKAISRLLKDLVDERVELASEQAKNECLLDYIEEIAPKARYCDLILQCDSALQISVIAKDYGLSAVAFNQLLHDLKIQYRIGRTWLLYNEHCGKGYTVSRTYHISDKKSATHTYWLPKGRRFIYETLKWHGILPEVERNGLHGTPSETEQEDSAFMGHSLEVLETIINALGENGCAELRHLMEALDGLEGDELVEALAVALETLNAD